MVAHAPRWRTSKRLGSVEFVTRSPVNATGKVVKDELRAPRCSRAAPDAPMQYHDADANADEWSS